MKALMQLFGDKEGGPGSAEESDPMKGFMDTISTFAKSFKHIIDEINNKKMEEEKAAKAEAEKAKKRVGVGVGVGIPLPMMVDAAAAGRLKKASVEGDKADLFASFHKAQAASPDSLIAEFKLKMAGKQGAKKNWDGAL